MAMYKTIFASEDYTSSSENIVGINGEILMFGESAFSSVKQALESGAENAIIIKVQSGKYDGFTVVTDGEVNTDVTVMAVDFDGGEVLVDGETITVADSGIDAAGQATILADLNDMNAGSGKVFVAASEATADMPTIYVGMGEAGYVAGQNAVIVYGAEADEISGGINAKLNAETLAIADKLYVSSSYNSSSEGFGKSKFNSFSAAYNYYKENGSYLWGLAWNTSEIVLGSGMTGQIENEHKDYKKLNITAENGATLWYAGNKLDMTYDVVLKAGASLLSNRPKNSTSYAHIKNGGSLTIGEAGSDTKATFDFGSSKDYHSIDVSVRYDGTLTANNAIIKVEDLDAQGTMTLTDTELTVEGALATDTYYQTTFTNSTVVVAGKVIAGGIGDFGGDENNPLAYNRLGNVVINNSEITFGDDSAKVVIGANVKMTGASVLSVKALEIADGKTLTMDSSSTLKLDSLSSTGKIVVNMVEGFDGKMIFDFSNAGISSLPANIEIKGGFAEIQEGDIYVYAGAKAEVDLTGETNKVDLGANGAKLTEAVGSSNKDIEISTGDDNSKPAVTETAKLNADITGKDVTIDNSKKLEVTGSIKAEGIADITNSGENIYDKDGKLVAEATLNGGYDADGKELAAKVEAETIVLQNDGHANVELKATNISIANNSNETLTGIIGDANTENVLIGAGEATADGLTVDGDLDGTIENADITAKNVTIVDQTVVATDFVAPKLNVFGDTTLGAGNTYTGNIFFGSKEGSVNAGIDMTNVTGGSIVAGNGEVTLSGTMDSTIQGVQLEVGGFMNPGGVGPQDPEMGATTVNVAEGAYIKTHQVYIGENDAVNEHTLNVYGKLDASASVFTKAKGELNVYGEMNGAKFLQAAGDVTVSGANAKLNVVGDTNYGIKIGTDEAGLRSEFTVENGASVNVGTIVNVGYSDTRNGDLIIDGGNFSAASVDVQDGSTFTVAGESTLNINNMSGEIDLLDGAIIKNSTVGGSAFVAGNVKFRGDNTFSMISDFGNLTDYYGTTAPMQWTVEEGASLTLTEKGRYGLGYGDKVVVNGTIAAGSASDARASLTDDNAENDVKQSLFMHGLVAQESKGWNENSSMTVNNAYVTIGSNNSFGNKPGNYGGTYTFNFNNSVLDSSRITFYEALSKTSMTFKDSDVKTGTFMTRDADSVFTLDNTKLVSSTATNGTDEGNYNAGTLNIIGGSDLTYTAELKNEGGIINITDSSFTANGGIVNNGTFTVGGESTLNIQNFAGDGTVATGIHALDGAVLKDSTVGGYIYLDGAATLTGSNTFAGINLYGQEKTHLTVAENASLTVADLAMRKDSQMTIYGTVTAEGMTSSGGTTTYINGGSLTTMVNENKNLNHTFDIANNGSLTLNNSYEAITVNMDTTSSLKLTGSVYDDGIALNVTGLDSIAKANTVLLDNNGTDKPNIALTIDGVTYDLNDSISDVITIGNVVYNITNGDGNDVVIKAAAKILTVNSAYTEDTPGFGLSKFNKFEDALQAASSEATAIKLESDVTVGSEIGYYNLPADLSIIADEHVTLNMAGASFYPMGKKTLVVGENVEITNMGQMIAYESQVILNGDFAGSHLWTFGWNGDAENGATGLTINETSKVKVSTQLEFRGGDVTVNGNITDTAAALGDADQIQLLGTTYGSWGGASGYATKVNLNDTYIKLAQNTIGGAATKFQDGSSAIVTMDNSIYETAAEGAFNVASTGLVKAENGSIIYINSGVRASNAGTINITDSTFESKSAFANSGTFTVSGDSTLKINQVTGEAIEILDGATITDSSVNGAVNLVSGTINLAGENSFTGGMLSAGYYNYTEDLTVNITGDFTASNMVAWGGSANKTTVNVGAEDAEKTTFNSATIGTFYGDTTLNISNADVTYGYMYVQGNLNVSDSTLQIDGGVNTYFRTDSSDHRIVIDNTTWNSGAFTDMGSYSGSVASGSAIVDIKNGSTFNAGNFTLTTTEGTNHVVDLTVDNSTLNATTAFKVGAGTSASFENGAVLNAEAITNNGYFKIGENATATVGSIVMDGNGMLDVWGQENGIATLKAGSITAKGENSGFYSSYGDITVDGAIELGGSFSIGESSLKADTFKNVSQGYQQELRNVDLDVTNFVNGENGNHAYAVIGGNSKVQIDNLSGYYSLRLADGTTLKGGTNIVGSLTVRALGDVTFGETENDFVHIDSFDNNNAAGNTMTVNGTLDISSTGKGFSTYWLGVNGNADTTTLTGAGTINANTATILQYGKIVVDKDLTINVTDQYAADLRFTLTDITIKGEINSIGSNNKLNAIQTSTVTLTGENAALNLDSYLLVGYQTYKGNNDTTDIYKSTVTLEDGAALNVGGALYINKDSSIVVDATSTFSAGSILNYGGMINSTEAGTIVLNNDMTVAGVISTDTLVLSKGVSLTVGSLDVDNLTLSLGDSITITGTTSRVGSFTVLGDLFGDSQYNLVLSGWQASFGSVVEYKGTSYTVVTDENAIDTLTGVNFVAIGDKLYARDFGADTTGIYIGDDVANWTGPVVIDGVEYVKGENAFASVDDAKNNGGIDAADITAIILGNGDHMSDATASFSNLTQVFIPAGSSVEDIDTANFSGKVVILNDGHMDVKIAANGTLDVVNTSVNTMLGSYTATWINVDNTGRIGDISGDLTTLTATLGDIEIANSGAAIVENVKLNSDSNVYLSGEGFGEGISVNAGKLFLYGSDIALENSTVDTIYMTENKDFEFADGGELTLKAGSVIGKVDGYNGDTDKATGTVIFDGADLTDTAVQDVNKVVLASGTDHSIGKDSVSTDYREFYTEELNIASGAAFNFDHNDTSAADLHIGTTVSVDDTRIDVTGEGEMKIANDGSEAYSMDNFDVSGFEGTLNVASGSLVALEEDEDHVAAAGTVKADGTVELNGTTVADIDFALTGAGSVKVNEDKNFTGDISAYTGEYVIADDKTATYDEAATLASDMTINGEGTASFEDRTAPATVTLKSDTTTTPDIELNSNSAKLNGGAFGSINGSADLTVIADSTAQDVEIGTMTVKAGQEFNVAGDGVDTYGTVVVDGDITLESGTDTDRTVLNAEYINGNNITAGDYVTVNTTNETMGQENVTFGDNAVVNALALTATNGAVTFGDNANVTATDMITAGTDITFGTDADVTAAYIAADTGDITFGDDATVSAEDIVTFAGAISAGDGAEVSGFNSIDSATTITFGDDAKLTAAVDASSVPAGDVTAVGDITFGDDATLTVKDIAISDTGDMTFGANAVITANDVSVFKGDIEIGAGATIDINTFEALNGDITIGDNSTVNVVATTGDKWTNTLNIGAASTVNVTNDIVAETLNIGAGTTATVGGDIWTGNNAGEGIFAADNVTVSAVNISGNEIEFGDTAQVTATGDMLSFTDITFGTDADVTAADIAAGMNITFGSDADVTAASITAEKNIIFGDNAAINVSGSITETDGGAITFGDNSEITVGGDIEANIALVADPATGSVNFGADNTVDVTGNIGAVNDINFGNSSEITVGKDVMAGKAITAGDNVTISAADISAVSDITFGTDAAVNAADIFSESDITFGSDADVTADSISAYNDITFGANAIVDVTGSITETDGGSITFGNNSDVTVGGNIEATTAVVADPTTGTVNFGAENTVDVTGSIIAANAINVGIATTLTAGSIVTAGALNIGEHAKVTAADIDVANINISILVPDASGFTGPSITLTAAVAREKIGTITVDADRSDFVSPYTVIDGVSSQTYNDLLIFVVGSESVNLNVNTAVAQEIAGYWVYGYVNNGDLQLDRMIVDNGEIFVNSDWTDSKGDRFYWGGNDIAHQHIVGNDAAKSLGYAASIVRAKDDGTASKIYIVKGDTYEVDDLTLMTAANGVSSLILSGDEVEPGTPDVATGDALILGNLYGTDGSSATNLTVNNIAVKGDFFGGANNAALSGDVTTVINNATTAAAMRGMVFGGSKVTSDIDDSAVSSSIALIGGGYSGTMVGGGAYVDGVTYAMKDSTIGVAAGENGDRTVISGRLFGGSVAANGATVNQESANINIDLSNGQVYLRSDVYAAGASINGGTVNVAEANVTINGDLSNLNFTGRLSGGVYGTAIGSATGIDSNLTFSDATGTFKGLIQDFDTITISGNSAVEFSRKQTLTADTDFVFDLNGKTSADAMFTVNSFGWTYGDTITINGKGMEFAADGTYTLVDTNGATVDFSGFSFTVNGKAYDITAGTIVSSGNYNYSFGIAADGDLVVDVDKLVVDANNSIADVYSDAANGATIEVAADAVADNSSWGKKVTYDVADNTTFTVQNGSNNNSTTSLIMGENGTVVGDNNSSTSLKFNSGSKLVLGKGTDLLANEVSGAITGNNNLELWAGTSFTAEGNNDIYVDMFNNKNGTGTSSIGEGSTVNINNCLVNTGNLIFTGVNSGVKAKDGSVLSDFGVYVHGQQANSNTGKMVLDNSTMKVANNGLTNNGGTGIELKNGSVLDVTGGMTTSGNRLKVTTGSTLTADVTGSTGNDTVTVDVDAILNGTIDLQSATDNDLLKVSDFSNLAGTKGAVSIAEGIANVESFKLGDADAVLGTAVKVGTTTADTTDDVWAMLGQKSDGSLVVAWGESNIDAAAALDAFDVTYDLGTAIVAETGSATFTDLDHEEFKTKKSNGSLA